MSITSSLSKILSIGSTITTLFPVIDSAIKSAESVLGTGNGAAKLALVQGIVESAYNAIASVETTWAEVSPAVTGVINALVTAYNAISAFAHGTATAATTAAAKTA